ncbi:hypothetical protein [Sulfitobacter sp. 915]|jgi:predicted transposase YbfD/YdcC|uniref:hypothetical protein n=1 Tax=Sulfitobacter sp. 915 TaxID=3368558 RepID=UPI00374738BD
MMVSAYVSRLHLTLATMTADRGTEIDAAIEALGLVALKGKVVTGDPLHCSRRTVAGINAGRRLVPAAEKQSGIPSVQRSRLFSNRKDCHPVARSADTARGRNENMHQPDCIG